MIVLPEGIYHRYTNDENNFIKAMRFFVGEPVWTPYNRKDIMEDANASRRKYIQLAAKERKRARTIEGANGEKVEVEKEEVGEGMKEDNRKKEVLAAALTTA